MGLRDEAEKVSSERDRQEHDRRQSCLARVRDFVPTAMAQWSKAMGLKTVPDYQATEPKFGHEGWGEDARVDLTFTEDGIVFEGVVRLPLDQKQDPFFAVTVQGDEWRRWIRNLDNLASVLSWEAERPQREAEREREEAERDYRARHSRPGLGMGNL